MVEDTSKRRAVFELAATLPSTDGADTAHGSSAGRTALYWVDADSEPPLEILVRHDDSQADDPEFRLLTFDRARKAYQASTFLPEMARDVLDKLTDGSGLAAF